jgi:hypothetical protein
MGSLYLKSLDALAVVRKYSIKFQLVDLYNDNLLALKTSSPRDYWIALLDHHKIEPVLFISSTESPASKLFPEEANNLALLEETEPSIVTGAITIEEEEQVHDEVWDF